MRYFASSANSDRGSIGCVMPVADADTAGGADRAGGVQSGRARSVGRRRAPYWWPSTGHSPAEPDAHGKTAWARTDDKHQGCSITRPAIAPFVQTGALRASRPHGNLAAYLSRH